MKQELSGWLNQLKLWGAKESVEYRLAEALKENYTFQDFLGLVLEDEVLYRKNKKSERLRRRAIFKDNARLEDFTASNERGVTKSMIKQIGTLDFVEQNHNIILVGPTGVGKSFLAQAMGHRACSSGMETFFIRVNRLLKNLEAENAAGSFLKYINKLSKIKILILDDFGLRNYTHEEANTLCDILEDRYQKGVVIITTQVRPAGWKTLFADPVIADAIIDRLV